jgi:hypothetical protein
MKVGLDFLANQLQRMILVKCLKNASFVALGFGTKRETRMGFLIRRKDSTFSSQRSYTVNVRTV